MTLMPAIRGCVLLHVTIVDGFASSHTSTGLLLAWTCIICVGEYVSHRNQVPRLKILHRESHQCLALCSAPGICQIDAAPMSIEATFTGRHETFQYTKVLTTLACTTLFWTCYSSFSLPSIHKVWPESFPNQMQGTALTYTQWLNDCNASRVLIQDRRHIRVLTSTARRNSHSTFVKSGTSPRTMSWSVKELRPCSCQNCGYYCTLPLGIEIFHQYKPTHVVRWPR